MVHFEQELSVLTNALLAMASHAESSVRQAVDAVVNRDYDLAISCFNEEIRQHPREAVAFANRGNAFVGKGELDRAIADFSQASSEPRFIRTIYGAGYLFAGAVEWSRSG